MTFEQAAKRKNRMTWIWLAVGAATIGALTWALQAFVVFVALQLSETNARLEMTVALALNWGAYFMGWVFRGNLVEGIDQQMATAGPSEKERFAARVKQELQDVGPLPRRTPHGLYPTKG